MVGTGNTSSQNIFDNCENGSVSGSDEGGYAQKALCLLTGDWHVPGFPKFGSSHEVTAGRFGASLHVPSGKQAGIRICTLVGVGGRGHL